MEQCYLPCDIESVIDTKCFCVSLMYVCRRHYNLVIRNNYQFLHCNHLVWRDDMSVYDVLENCLIYFYRR
jgi:hypothetical protein